MAKSRTRTTILVMLLVISVLVLVGVASVVIPIISHQSAGGSGQSLPDSYVSEVRATGADGRTRQLVVTTESGEPADLSQVREGETLIISGSGFDSNIGIYVSVCALPSSPGAKPQPCLGGIPEGATEKEVADSKAMSSAWVSDDWAWRAFATHRWSDAQAGAFQVEIAMPAPTEEALDCTLVQCAVTTRADHTAGADRVQDIQLPVQYATDHG